MIFAVLSVVRGKLTLLVFRVGAMFFCSHLLHKPTNNIACINRLTAVVFLFIFLVQNRSVPMLAVPRKK